MKYLLRLILCALCFSQAQATILRLETVKQPLYLMGDGDSKILISDVPYITYGSDPEWRFSAICAPCILARNTKKEEDVNLVSRYNIIVYGTYKVTENHEVSRDIEVTIDISKAAVPENYPFTIEQVIDATTTCIKLMYPPKPVDEGKLEIKIVGGKPDAKKP